MFLIEIQKCQEIKHYCPKQPDVDCKELMKVNMWEAGDRNVSNMQTI
jgi:hypothetical protein